MKKHLVKFSVAFRMISVILSFLIAVTSLPLSVIAEDISARFVDSDTPSEKESVSSFIFEETSLRTPNTKTVHLEDGSFYLATYDTDVHRLTDDDTYADIDNTLKKSGEYIVNSDGNIILSSNVKGNHALLTVHPSDNSSEGKSVSFRLTGNVNSSKGKITNTDQKFNDDASELEKLTTLSKINSSVTYENVFSNTDIEYILHGSDVTENIIVKETDEEYVYSFELSLSGYTAEKSESGEIIITDTDSGETAYRIPAPVMWDKSGDYSSDIEVSFSECTPENTGLEFNENTSVYALTYTASATWINDSSRSFPVTIDPPIYSSSSNVTDIYVSESSQSTSYNTQTLNVGNGFHSYWKINTLPTIPSLAYITDATVTFENTDCTCTGTIGVYEVTSDWSSTLTWNSAGNNYSSAPSDYVVMPDDRNGFVDDESNFPDGLYTWSILPFVRKWYDGENYGLMLMPVDNSFSGTATFCSNEYSVQSSRPYLTVTYKNFTGIEDYLTYSSFSADLAGNAYVNNATGNQIVTIPTLTTADSIFSITPTLVYNYNLNFADYKYSANGIQSANKNTHTAKSFKLNINETLIKKSFTDSAGATVYYFIWSDSDGTEHYFLPKAGSTSVYEDEDGLGLTLSESTSYCTVTDKSHTVRRFSKCSYSLSDVASAWYLSSVTDSYDNSVLFSVNYGDTYNRIREITLVPSGFENSEGITQLKLLYNSAGKLSCIYNPASGQGVVFRYANSYSGSTGTTYGNYLKTVVRAHGATTDSQWNTFYDTNSNVSTSTVTVDAVSAYSYNYLGLMTKITDTLSNQQLNFNTYSSKRISTVYESETLNSYTGQKVLFEYGTDYTTLRTSGKDDVYNNADDIITHYVFDKSARCISSYSTDVSGKTVYGISQAEYVDKEENEKAVNSLKNTGYASDTSPNLILNPTFIQNGQNSWLGWGKSSNGGVSFCSDAETYNQNLYDTDFNVKLSKKSTDTYISQNMYLDKGTYTLSCDVINFENPNITAYLEVIDNDSEDTIAAEQIKFSTEYDLAEPVMTSVVFDSSYDGYEVTVRLVISGGSYTSDDYILLRQMSVTKNAGTGLISKVEFGGFEDANPEDGTDISDKWTSSVSSRPFATVSDTTFGGRSLSMTGTGVYNTDASVSPDTEYKVSQILYEATDAEYNAYIAGNGNFPLSSKQYRVSARAKASDTIPNDRSLFELRLTFTCKYTDADGTVTEEIHSGIPFNKYTSDWQYICGIISSPAGIFIQKITVDCVYSNQVGTALFDDITVCFVGIDENRIEYEYNANGNLKVAGNGRQKTWYVYGDADNSNLTEENDVIAVIQPRYATVYTYGSRHTVTEERIYTFTTDYDSEYYGFDYSNPPSSRLMSQTTYSYNNYGLIERTTTQSLGETLITSGTYNLQSGSHIFGSVISQTDDCGNTTQYSYYTDTGALKAAVDPLGNGIKYTYDSLGRMTEARPCTQALQNIAGSSDVSYSYTGEYLTEIDTISTEYDISYDSFGNMASVSVGGSLLAEYIYNSGDGKLTRINHSNGQKVKYLYDTLERISEIQYNSNGGDTFSTAYSYTTASNLSGLTYTTVYYTYDSPEEYSNNYFGGLWGDLLTNYNGQEITYDADGNPLTVGEDISLTWTQGRRLARYTLYGDVDIEITYNSDGIRTRKTVEGITHYYTLDGSRILSEEWTTGAGSNAVRHLMVYVYDASGSPIGFRYRNSGESSGVFHEYIYGKNIHGDILYIFGLDGTLYASYVYDAWGKQSVTYYNSGNNNNLVPGVKYNPFTYRGYYYDSETGLYQTGTRYYNPEIGRFINADGQLNPGTGLIGLNLFAYCNNNPVNMADPDGNIPFFLITAAIGAVAGAVVGGIIATKNGGNVWAGIGIGAAAGGLIGLGAGAAASAMLAGSIAATTTEVVVGGAGLVSAVSAGGVGAGAAYIADNVINAMSRSAPVLQESVNNVYYQVTSKAGAAQITDSKLLEPMESAYNYVLNFQPTLEQAQQTGARAIETVIRFSTTYTSFVKDTTCAIIGALVANTPGVIRLFDVVEVGFK